MWLGFLRHATAEDRRVDLRDEDRALTADGTAEARLMGEMLSKLHLDIEAVFTSPLLRARQTAEIVARALGLDDQVHVVDVIAGDFGIGALKRILGEHPALRRVLIVGHEPSMSATVATLIGGGEVRMRKGALAAVRTDVVEAGAGQLSFLLSPALVRALMSGKPH